MLETIGLLLLMAAIVWLSYRYYGNPESEYLHVLDRLPVDDFSHLETESIEQHIDESHQKLKKLDDKLAKSEKEHAAHLRLERIRLRLLTYELHKRECAQDDKNI